MGGRRLTRPWLVLPLLAGLLAGAHAAASPAAAAAAAGASGACPTLTGVTVVVDFGTLRGGSTGGRVWVSCAPGAQANGLAALAHAGFAVDLVSGAPFVCHINGMPSNQTCENYPPANAYWGYWAADRGGSWSYASGGAGNAGTAPQGSVQGWAFESGSKAPPSVAPPAVPVATPKPTPRPTPRPTPAPTPHATAAPTAAPTTPAQSEPAATPATAAASATAGPSASAQPSDGGSASPPDDAGPTPDPSAAAVVSAPSQPDDSATAAPGTGPAPAADDPGAPPIGTLAGAGLVVVLLSGGWLLSRRRGTPGA